MEQQRNMLKKRIREYISNYACCYFCKAYRQSAEWRDKNIAEKLAYILGRNKDIDNFIEYLIDNE